MAFHVFEECVDLAGGVAALPTFEFSTAFAAALSVFVMQSAVFYILHNELFGVFSASSGPFCDPLSPCGVFGGSFRDSSGLVSVVSVVCWLPVSVDSRGSVSCKLGLVPVWLCEWLGEVILLLSFGDILGLVEGRPLLFGGLCP